MKIIPFAGVILTVLTVGTSFVAMRQHQLLGALHRTGDGFEKPPLDSTTIDESVGRPTSPGNLTQAEHEELLNLRGQVRPLLDQLAERNSDTNRHARLLNQIEAIQKIKAPPGPGYIPRAEARNLGNGTPEAAMETVLWAVQHRDTNVLFGVLGSPMRESMVQQLVDQGAEKFFQEAFAVAGLRIVGSKQVDAETSELTFEPLPGESETVKFHRENNGWVMAP